MIINRSYIYRIYLNNNQREKFDSLYDKNLFLFNLIVNKFNSDSSFININQNQLKKVISEYKELNNGNFLSYLSTFKLVKNVIIRSNLLNQKISFKNKDIFPKKLHFTNKIYSVLKIKNAHIFIPFVGIFKIKYHRNLPSNIIVNDIVIEKNSNEKFDLNISFSKEVSCIKIEPKKCLGLDYSSPHFIVDSNGFLGDKIITRNFKENRISFYKRKLSRCKFKSKNYYKICKKIENLFCTVTNKRKYIFHLFANKLVKNNDLIGVEALSLSVIAQSNHLGKHTYENAYNKFLLILKYKLESNGKHFIMVPKYFPSTRICNNCGLIHKKLELSQREFICECGYKEDRDINAALNIMCKAISLFKMKYPCPRV